MSERNERGQQERPSAGKRSRHAQSRSNLLNYMTVLFAVAFLLLLIAYFQQRRLSEQAATDALKQSSSAVQTIQSVMEENASLKEEAGQLREEMEALKSDHEALKELYLAEADGRAQQEGALAAMDWFWQIDEAYVRQRYSLCRELIDELKQSGYESFLPDTKATTNDRFSPRARYEEICKAVY